MTQPAHYVPALDQRLTNVFAAVLADESAHPIIEAINDTMWDAPGLDATPIQFDADQLHELAALLAVTARTHGGTDPLPPT